VLVISGEDYNIVKGYLERTFQGPTGSVNHVYFCPDRRVLVSASTDQTIKLWDTETGAILQSLDISTIVDSLQFSSNSSYPETNVGQCNMTRVYRCRSSVEMANSLEVQILQDKWIALSNKSFRWLPPDYRPTCSDGVVIIDVSGRASFLGFHL
jgi:WD40 repeat protein